MALRLIRLDDDGIRTRGALLVAGRCYFTVECPWLDNAPFVSCVPVGRYLLEAHSSSRRGETWALVGETVSHYASALPRYACLLHVANTVEDVVGCIGPGLLATEHGNARSGDAMRELRELADGRLDPFAELEILEGWIGGATG